MISSVTGASPQFTLDGPHGQPNESQAHEKQLEYLEWIRKNVDFIPTSCPEELVLQAIDRVAPGATKSQDHKDH